MPDINEIINFSRNDDSQEQKQRDRELRERNKKSRDKYENMKYKQLWKMRLAKHIINDLKNYGPANLIHVNVLSSLTKRPIRIWKSMDNLYRIVNDETNDSSNENFIDIEYHEQSLNYNVGHWTLLNNKDPINVELDLNACLFAVIAAQIGKSTNDLRNNVIDFLTNNIKQLIDQIDEFIYLDNNNEKLLMIGGARYIGTSPKAAGIILDKSQNVFSHTCKAYGHPRGHASDTAATGPCDSVENYSRTTKSMKSGFLNKSDQNNVAHLALSHEVAQQAMRELNNGATSMTVTLSRRDLQKNHRALPKMREYYNGEPYSKELDIIQVTLVLRHHQDKYNDPNADVFVHTCFPRSS
ncbi:uncharacterized protein LOC107965359 [Apis mellifera]|uniref:Uncharacterized protein LOC107965359 n=1 Tax=Apis mellifera TaxID=7460 RepID=A0A7M7IPU2_APIME|nr:uncharacterized protein LOC107965359 [Apis mellifera]|eukprot:XP_016771026.2 uncharacterized protein LOC107965359 [Apis mellifera]